MPRAKFILRSPSDKKDQTIVLIFRYKKNRFFRSLGVKVPTKYWNSNTQRLRKANDFTDRDQINDFLNELASAVEHIYNTLVIERKEVDNQILGDLIDQYLNPNKSSSGFMNHFNNFIESSPKRISPKTNRPISKSTISTYQETYKVLAEFQNLHYTLSFEKIDLDFYYDFVAFMQEKKNFGLNYAGKHIKNLKSFLSDSTEKGINKNLAFKSKRFSVLKESIDHIYLSTEELDQLQEYDFSFDKNLERAVDLFLLGAHTGLRVSDFTQVSKENIIKRPLGYVLKIRTQKTDETVFIPFTPSISILMNKYEDAPPPLFSENYINRLIKVAGRLAGIKTKVSLTKTKAGRKITQVYFKYELIQTHTARRSFCTNAYLAGVDTLDIMTISGHKTESSFRKYIKVSKQQHADKMLAHPYFSKQKLKVI